MLKYDRGFLFFNRIRDFSKTCGKNISNAVAEKKNELNLEFMKKIIYNSVLQKAEPVMDYYQKKKLRKFVNRSDNLLKISTAQASSFALKYLEEESCSKVVEEQESLNEDMFHFPFDIKKSHISNSKELELNLSDHPPIDFIKWNEKKNRNMFEKYDLKKLVRKMEDHTLNKEQINAFDDEYGSEIMYGTADASIPISNVPCGGCGSLLHCQDTSIPGFVPREVFHGSNVQDLRSLVCQRCYFLKEYDMALGVTVPSEEYPKILSHLCDKRALVILMVDLLDFPCSIWPNILSIIGYKRPVVVVGNKIDLIPEDSIKFHKHLKDGLVSSLDSTGISRANIKHLALISAKTGYGVESLITKLHKCWLTQGDVYIVGCTNVGKSTLFNTLIQSDYCKVQAVDVVQRATTSRWPGTTLNLLKFPILRPSGWRLYVRTQRLISKRPEMQAHEQMRREALQQSRYKKQKPLLGYMGRTFVPESPVNEATDPFALRMTSTPGLEKVKGGLEEEKEEFAESKWCYDTPGVVHPEQILDLLTTAELVDTLPKSLIVPRNFHLRPGTSLFIAGIARLDFDQGPDLAWFTVFASPALPVTVVATSDADHVYKELLGSELLRVPRGSKQRLNRWPELAGRSLRVEQTQPNEAAADIVLSSAGWVAITLKPSQVCTLTAWTPEARGIHLRLQPVVKKAFNFRGAKIQGTPAFKPNIRVDDDNKNE